MRKHRNLTASFAALALLALAACTSDEEKAEQRYAEATQLYEEGETERAMVALRNVFRLNGEHRDARMMLAEILRGQGSYENAFRHYQLVTEQYPDDMEARIALSRMALNLGAWDVAREQVAAAALVDADEQELAPLEVAVAYGNAVQEEDSAAEASALAAAQQMLESRPEDQLLLRLVIDGLTRQERFSAALDVADTAIASFPVNADFNQQKLNLVARLNDMDALGAHLHDMVERFPDNQEIRTALVRWYLAVEDPDGAEAFVRRMVAEAGTETAPRIALVQFLAQVRGTEAALAELDRLVEEGHDPDTFRLYRATLTFDTGRRAPAIDEVEAMIEGREDTDETREMKTTLARMLIADGQQDRARVLVDEVLASDDAQVEALKLRAAWLIQEDRVRDAVLALRTALDQAPSDAEAITLLAQAHERGGNRELMAESLSRAVEASNGGAEEAIRYARYLIQEDKLRVAEDVLIRAVRLTPTDLGLLQMLGQVYLQLNELPRTEQVAQTLRRVDTAEAQALATGFEAAILQRMNRTDESIMLMQSMIDDGQAGLAGKTAIIRARLANGEVAEARAYIDEVLAETSEDDPDRHGVEFLNAALTASEGDLEGAREIYRGILDDRPDLEAVWRALIATLSREGDLDAAIAVTDEAIEALPEAAGLLWIKAGLAERGGDIDGAIAIYEDLYARDSGSTIIANNLASLITTHREDDESLQRAFVIARRLRGSEIPAFQDTYGWIAYRLGNHEEALGYLEPAAQGLPDDPAVQYHLARTYEAMGRDADAVARYERAIALWDGAAGDLAAKARSDFAALKAAMERAETNAPDGTVGSGNTPAAAAE